MNNCKILFMDIDTQKDFIDQDGALYVRGAEEIRSNLKKLTELAHKNNYYILASKDVHIVHDPEFMDFPPHCVINTPGLNKIPETIIQDPKIIPENSQTEINIESLRYIVEKSTYDPFANPYTKKIIEKINPDIVVVYGVATDYCIKASILALIKMRVNTILVIDAIKGIVEPDSERLIKEFEEKGVKLLRTEEILRGILCESHLLK